MWEEKTGVYVCYSIGDKFDEKLTPPLAPTTLDGMVRPPTEPGIPHVYNEMSVENIELRTHGVLHIIDITNIPACLEAGRLPPPASCGATTRYSNECLG